MVILECPVEKTTSDNFYFLPEEVIDFSCCDETSDEGFWREFLFLEPGRRHIAAAYLGVDGEVAGDIGILQGNAHVMAAFHEFSCLGF